MTRKDFQLIADVLVDVTGPVISSESRNQIAKALASALRSTNPNFNRDRFLAACGVKEA